MNTEREPIRWLEAAGEVSEELRSALLEARAELPSEEVLRRIEAGAVAKAAAASQLGWLVKLFVGLTVAAVIGLQFWPEGVVVEREIESVPSVPSATLTATATATATPTEEVVMEPGPARSPERVRPKAEVPDELELLEAAQRALAGAPKEALRLTRLSARHHPKGQFVPEREALAIQALVKLGRQAEAQERFERLRSRSPRAAVLGRLEELLRTAE